PGVLSNDTDANNDVLTAVQFSTPSHGTVTSNANGGFTYTPTAGFQGLDSFTYKASDGPLTSNTATVVINVTSGINVAPVGKSDSFLTAEDTTLRVQAPGV